MKKNISTFLVAIVLLALSFAGCRKRESESEIGISAIAGVWKVHGKESFAAYGHYSGDTINAQMTIYKATDSLAVVLLQGKYMLFNLKSVSGSEVVLDAGSTRITYDVKGKNLKYDYYFKGGNSSGYSNLVSEGSKSPLNTSVSLNTLRFAGRRQWHGTNKTWYLVSCDSGLVYVDTTFLDTISMQTHILADTLILNVPPLNYSMPYQVYRKAHEDDQNVVFDDPENQFRTMSLDIKSGVLLYVDSSEWDYSVYKLQTF